MKKSIRREIFTLVICVVTLPFVLISGVTYYVSLNAVKQEFQSSSELVLNNLSFNIDQYLMGIENATLFAYMNKPLQNSLSQLLEKPEAFQKIENQKQIENFMSSIESTIKHVSSIQFLSGNRVFYTGTTGYDLVGADYNYNYREDEWYRKTVANPSEKMLFGTHKPFQRKFSNDLVISFARVVNEVSTGQYLGVILIDIRLDSIREILALSETNKRNFIIIDEQGTVVYASKNGDATPTTMLNMDQDALQQIIGTQKGSLFTRFAGDNMFVNYLTSDYSDWKVIQYVNEADMVQDSVKLMRMFLALAVGSIGVAIIFMLFISRRVSRPIIDLSKQVKLVGQGKFDVNLESSRENELGMLYRGLRKMIDDLKQYIEWVAAAKTKQKEAQYSALKSQINPHFLANTLESIQMQAVLNDQRDLGEMIGVLGRLFKIHTQTEKQMVPFKDELAHIRLYLKLQKMRHGDRLRVVEQIEPECLSLYVVHFMLQPLVENAITYGLEPMTEPVEIAVGACLEDGMLRVTVADNGRGMTADRLAEVNERLAQDAVSLDSGHIGLQNVHDRIRLFCGEQYGLRVDSVQHEGTRITIWLPVLDTAPERV